MYPYPKVFQTITKKRYKRDLKCLKDNEREIIKDREREREREREGGRGRARRERG